MQGRKAPVSHGRMPDRRSITRSGYKYNYVSDDIDLTVTVTKFKRPTSDGARRAGRVSLSQQLKRQSEWLHYVLEQTIRT